MGMKRRVVIVGLLVAGVAVAAGISRRGPGGQPTARAAVDEYLAALGRGDRDRLSRVADPDHDASGEIDARIKRLGGDHLVVGDVQIADGGTRATVVGRLDGAAYSDILALTEHKGRWYVVLGPAMQAPAKG
jgi:hypothetical protein